MVGHLDAFSLSSPFLLALVSPNEESWVAVNHAFAHATARIERDIAGSALDSIVHPEDIEIFRERLADIAAGERVSDFRVRLLREDGSPLSVTWAGFARRGTIYFSGTVADARRLGDRGEERAGAVLPLFAEIQHRARNTLGVIRSIVRRTARTSASVGDFEARLDGRLAAYARVQNAILRSPSHGVALD